MKSGHGANFAHLHRLNHGVHGTGVNHATHAMANNRNGRISERTLATNSALRHGNAFANERWGGHQWRDHGFRRYWAGGVFWPYFVGDYFSYAFWPYDYYDAFWGWGPDSFLWSAFWPNYDYPYWDYGYSAGTPDAGDIYGGYRAAIPERARRVARVSGQEAVSTCAAFAPGVNGLPVQRLEETIQPTEAQRQAFDDLEAAMIKATDILNNACPAETPLTPVVRLDAMEQRLKAMGEAMEVIHGPLERLYGDLTEQQRQKLDAAVANGKQPAQMDLAKLCSNQAGFVRVPEDGIAQTIKLNERQMQDLDNLKQASAQAAEQLRGSCPSSVPDGINARLDAAQARIGALIRAIDTVRPAVETFFASLTDAQKSALNSRAPQTRTASARHR
ncbi:MAG: Spy/CpxP family protein refolding chaperone [Rhodomicrobium sp.]